MIKRYKFQPLPIVKLIPNLITFIALLIGVTAIRYALNDKWEESLTCVIIAALLDGLDGGLARILHASTPFGAEIDSLCDFANFGIIPGILIYLWLYHNFNFQLITWGAVLFYIGCLAIRLARFNLTSRANNKDSKNFKYFFMGIPAPVAGSLCLLPIMIDLKISDIFDIKLRSYNIYILIYLLIISFLSASRIPTFSIKHIKIPQEYIWLYLIMIILLLVCLFLYPWYLAPVMGLLYIISIIISSIVAKNLNL